MKPDQIVTVLKSVLLALLGWLIGYISTIRRDRLSKRRDLRTQYLLDAYRRLEGASERLVPGTIDERALESAVSDIQLLGSSEQVRLAEQFATEFVNKRQASVNPLLQSLRLELRKELDLSPLDNGIKILRITRKPESQRP